MKSRKRTVLSMALVIALLLSVLMPAGVVSAEEGYANAVLNGREDAQVTHNGQNTLAVDYLIRTGENKIGNASGIVVAFDNTLYEFLDWKGNPISKHPDADGENLFEGLGGEKGGQPVNVKGMSFMNIHEDWSENGIYYTESKDGATGYVIMQIQKASTMTKKYNDVVLCSCRLGYREGKTAEDANYKSLRFPTIEEAGNPCQQSEIWAISDGTDSYQAGKTDGSQDNLPLPTMGTFPGSDKKPSLGGEVTIAGGAAEAKQGTALEAKVSGAAIAENLRYTWKRDGAAIAGADGTSYTTTKDDVNKKITVAVDHEDYGAIVSNEVLIYDVPDKPVISSVAQGALTLTAKWTAPADNSSAIMEYKLEYATSADMSGATTVKAEADATQATISDLTEGTTYYLRLTAANKAGDSAPSDIVNKEAIALISAGEPSITKQPEAVGVSYGKTADLKVEVELTSRPDKGKLSYQWYRNTENSTVSGTAIEGANAAAYTTPILNAGDSYYYCEILNTDSLADVPDAIKGSTTAGAVTNVAKVTVTKAPLNKEGFAAKENVSAYVNSDITLDTLMTMNATSAGAVNNESLVQVLDLANAKVSDSAIVKFQTPKSVTEAAVDASGSAIVITTTKAVDVDYAEVVKTVGTYTYEVNIDNTASTNYALNEAFTLKGELKVTKKSSGGGGGGGGGGGSATTPSTDKTVEKNLSSSGTTISVSELKDAKSITVKNAQVSVVLNQNAVNALDQAKSLLVKAEKKSGTTMADSAKELIGSRPVFDVTATQDGKAVTSFGSGRITIGIAYTPQSDEETSKLFLYYIDEKGNAEKVSGSRYDGTTKMVVGDTNHLSLYAVGYDKNAATEPVQPTGTFQDMSSADWFYNAVMDLVKKGIVSGIPVEDKNGNPTGAYNFKPQANVSRAEFVTMLAKTAGVDLSNAGTSKFSDVKSGDWYAGAVAWAAENGVASGTGDGMFRPTANITRQDMAVMIQQFLTKVAKTTLEETKEAIAFTDAGQISDYAGAAVAAMQKTGVISGVPNEDSKGNPIGTYRFAPKANATRAEAAAMLSNLLNSVK